MELIKALEQLSLEVRNKNEILNISSSSSSSSVANHQWQLYNTQPITCKSYQNQLHDFNNSIETLFTQITELEIPEPKHKSHFDSKLKRTRFAHLSMSEQNYSSGSSMETSQEEDSDCSLHRCSTYSGGMDRKAAQSNPLVRDLMKRDLSAITDTVKKISRILTLGNDIEIIYNNYLSGQQVDLKYTRSLCDAFIELCAGEPHIQAMPTILRYTEHCKRFMTQYGDFKPLCPTETATAHLQQSSSVEKSNIHNNLNQDYDRNEYDEFDHDELGEITTTDISANTWTNNKLYIDSNQGFK